MLLPGLHARIRKLLLISLRLISASLGVLVLLLMARVLVIVTLRDDSCGGTMVSIYLERISEEEVKRRYFLSSRGPGGARRYGEERRAHLLRVAIVVTGCASTAVEPLITLRVARRMLLSRQFHSLPLRLHNCSRTDANETSTVERRRCENGARTLLTHVHVQNLQ